jgi:hypothetical protein
MSARSSTLFHVLPGRALLLAGAFTLMAAPGAAQQGRGGGAQALRTIEERTAAMRKLDGFFPLYFDSAAGQLFMEIPRLNTEVLHIMGLGAGLGSNDIGLDRGGLMGSRIVTFERSGPRVMMVQPNYDFRSSSTNPAEVRAVRDAFARSILWGFQVAAESDGGRRVLVDMTDFLLRDASNIAQRLTPGSYRLDNTRSSVYLPMTMNFPKNTEMEAELTFIAQPGGAGGGGGRGGGGAFFVCTLHSSNCRMRTTRRARMTRVRASSARRGATIPRRSSSRRCSGSLPATGWRR